MTEKEIIGGFDQYLNSLEEFTMGHFSAEMAPKHFNRVQPRAISRQVEQDQSACRTAHDCFNFIILMSDEIVPCHINGSRRVLV
jgi:hypothetical protein